MSYIGNTVENQNYVPAIDYFNGNGSTTAFTLSRPVASVAAVQAVISNVPQNPGSAFTVSGSTITFTSAPPSGTSNIYVYYTSPNTQVVQPGQGTVGTIQLADASVTAAKLASTTGTGAVALASLPSFTTTLGVGGATAANTGSGITFPATQSASSDANTLDDYEEGTFTPTITSTGTFAYSSQRGSYTKIGNIVVIQVDISLSSQSGGSGQLNIGGMPFNIINITTAGVPTIMVFGDNNWTTPRSNLCGYAGSTPGTVWQVFYNSGTNLTTVNVTDIGQSGRILITGTYKTST